MCVQVENTDCHQYNDDFRKLVLLVLVLEEARGKGGEEGWIFKPGI